MLTTMGKSDERTIALGFPFATYFGLVVSSFGFALLMYASGYASFRAAGHGRLRTLDLDSMPVLACGALFAVIAWLLLWARQPRGAKVTWDEHGITEWDGEGVVTAISWSNAMRYQVGVRRGSHVAPGQVVGSTVQFSDPSDRRITISMNVRPPTFSMRRRSVGALRAIHATHATVRPAEKIIPHGSSRYPRWRVWPLRAGYALLAFAVFRLGDGVDPMGAAGAFALASLLLFLRALRPLFELLQNKKIDGAFRDALPVELIGNDGNILFVRDDQGRTAAFDTTTFHHPDALLATRRGRGFLRAASSRPEGYRGQSAHHQGHPLVHPEAYESAGIRQARRDLQRALIAELVIRLLVALSALGLAVPILMH